MGEKDEKKISSLVHYALLLLTINVHSGRVRHLTGLVTGDTTVLAAVFNMSAANVQKTCHLSVGKGELVAGNPAAIVFFFTIQLLNLATT